ncbi:unnamed protein product [Tenebrio molitor]|nr:unnamed protein product [Tenebrio molitor]
MNVSLHLTGILICNIIRNFNTPQLPSSGIIVINANTKRTITASLNDIRQLISQQMPSSGIIVRNVNLKRNGMTP